jgi:hypothetical protein
LKAEFAVHTVAARATAAKHFGLELFVASYRVIPPSKVHAIVDKGGACTLGEREAVTT